MTWSPGWLQAASQKGVQPVFLLRFYSGTAFVGGLGQVGSISSHADDAGITPIIAGVSVSGNRITPQTWASTIGAWSVDIAGKHLKELLQYAVRGSSATLFVAWGMDNIDTNLTSDFEPIASGMLQDITGTPPLYTLQFWDITSELATRRRKTASAGSLFDGAGSATTTTATYTHGVTTSLAVTETGNFLIGDSGGVFSLRLDDGTDVYLTFTGRTATSGAGSLTGISTVAKFGTTMGDDAASGNAITPGAWLSGHVADIARRLICSTGSGSNGAYDLDPDEWGIAVDSTKIDHDDFDAWRDEVILNGNGTADDWDVVVFEEKTNAYTWLSGLMKEAGLWLTVRQGLLTIRSAQNMDENALLNEAGSASVQQAVKETGWEITDADIVSLDSWSCWSGSSSVEYGKTTVTNGNISPKISSLGIEFQTATYPTASVNERSIAQVEFDNSYTFVEGVEYRTYLWDVRIPESLDLTLAPFAWAALTPGDIVRLTTSQMGGRDESPMGGMYDNRRVMVTAVSCDWMVPTVKVSLAILPEYSTEIP